MAKYKSLPYYELIRNGKTIAFDIDGFYETDNKGQIKLLDSCKPFIKRIVEQETKEMAGEEEYPKFLGGGYYELSNGEKVQGKDKAIEAQSEI